MNLLSNAFRHASADYAPDVVLRTEVEAHGGKVGVGERDGGGACFTVRLPLASPGG